MVVFKLDSQTHPSRAAQIYLSYQINNSLLQDHRSVLDVSSVDTTCNRATAWPEATQVPHCQAKRYIPRLPQHLVTSVWCTKPPWRYLGQYIVDVQCCTARHCSWCSCFSEWGLVYIYTTHEHAAHYRWGSICAICGTQRQRQWHTDWHRDRHMLLHFARSMNRILMDQEFNLALHRNSEETSLHVECTNQSIQNKIHQK